MGLFGSKQLQSDEYLKLHKDIEVLKTELEQTRQKLSSLRALVNRKLGYVDEDDRETSSRNQRFNNDVILPM